MTTLRERLFRLLQDPRVVELMQDPRAQRAVIRALRMHGRIRGAFDRQVQSAAGKLNLATQRDLRALQKRIRELERMLRETEERVSEAEDARSERARS